jgi:diguanylate cyclase (GGDEF)-like protein/PAS domain S-box-containing protein
MQGRDDQRHELLERLVDGAPVAMVVVDEIGTIEFCSEASARLFGYSAPEAVGTNILDYIDAEWNPLALESIATALDADGLRLPMLFRIKHADGSRRVVEVTANSQTSDPVVRGMAAYLRPWDEQATVDEIIEALAGDEPLESKLELFVKLMAGETLDADGSVLYRPVDGHFTRHIASPSLSPALAGDIEVDAGNETPWQRVLASGTEQLVATRDLPLPLRLAALAQGYAACWAFGVTGADGQVRACLVLWRRDDRPMEEAFLAWIRRLVRLTYSVLEQDEIRARLIFEAAHDPLTGRANRATFFSRFQEAVEAAADGSSIGVLYIDLDDFKPVNDRLGHAAGDAVLVALARRLAARVREGDLVARMGGDEFAVLCPNVDAPEVLQALADRLVAAAREPVVVGDEVVHVGASVGVSVAPAGACSIDELVEAADTALYAVKAGAGNGFLLKTVAATA